MMMVAMNVTVTVVVTASFAVLMCSHRLTIGPIT